MSRSKVTAINHGSIPSEEMLLAFAKALGCSVMDFFEDEEGETRTQVKPENADEEDILRIYRNLSRRNKHEFMTMISKARTSS